MGDEGEPDEPEAGAISLLIVGAIFSVCGVLMAVKLLSGEAEFVHGGRTRHWVVTLLGENLFRVVSTIVCLLLGAAGSSWVA